MTIHIHAKHTLCAGGGIGRHERLKISCLNKACGFDSRSAHHRKYLSFTGGIFYSEDFPRAKIPFTEGLTSLSVRCVQPIQQHGRRVPALKSLCARVILRTRVSFSLAFSTQQIHSLRANGVISSQVASASGLSRNICRKSFGTVS